MANQIRAVTFLNAVTAAGPSQNQPLDYRGGGMQQRRLIVACVSGDSIIIEVSCDGGNSWAPYATLAGPQASSVNSVDGPFTNLRVNKTGTTGVATVKGCV